MTPQKKTELALPLLRYFTQTYGTKVWVIAWDSKGEGRRAWYMDFSSTLHNPAYAEALPTYERPWFRTACWHDYWASYAMEKGTPFVIFEDKELQAVTNEFPKVLL